MLFILITLKPLITLIDSTAVNPESITSAKGSASIQKATVPELTDDELFALGDKVAIVLKSENGYKTNLAKDDRILLAKRFWDFLESGEPVEKLVVVNTAQCSSRNLAEMYTTRTLTNMNKKLEGKESVIWGPPGVPNGDEKKTSEISSELVGKYVQPVNGVGALS